MIRPTNLVIFAAAACIGFGVFHAKHQVQELQEEYARVGKQIVAERDAMHVLRAEWSYLNQPQRLADMARRHLDLQPMATAQLGRLDALPTKPGTSALPMLAEMPLSGTSVSATAPSSVPGPAAKSPHLGATLAAAKLRVER
jgi:cell division protein FtsL